MDIGYIVMLVAAFLSATLLIVGLGQLVSVFFERHEREWELAQRRNDSRRSALVQLLKQVLVAEGIKLQSIDKIYRTLKIDVRRAKAGQTAEEYLADTLFGGLMIFVIGAVACVVLFGATSLFIPLVVALAWIYFVKPSMVSGDAEARTRAIYRRIPYALDLAVLVLQAGGTLREALDIVSVGDDPLAEELRGALKEVDAGATEGSALKRMSQRIGLESLESIVMAIVRGQETGAPMAHTLTTQAELFRERRLQELEKLAVEAPTKMTFPNMLVMLSVLILILGPVLVKIATSGLT
jgi:tight adherence protein C